jgi:hypothetical protein
MRKMAGLVVTALTLTPIVAAADVVDERLQEYAAQGGSGFSAAAGAKMWAQQFPAPKIGGEPRSCAACHTRDLAADGKHVETGKRIDPLKPSVNAKRLTDVKQIEKWFGRNCKWTLGRECTPKEKGDFLLYIRG